MKPLAALGTGGFQLIGSPF